jgi:hypothetical protein
MERALLILLTPPWLHGQEDGELSASRNVELPFEETMKQWPRSQFQ